MGLDMDPIQREEALVVLNKVPEVTIWFWIIKIMATTVGETAADFLNVRLHFGLSGTSIIMSVLLAAFLVMQVREQKYVPWLYWVTVVLISIVGTLITDNLVDNLGITLETTSLVFGLALAVTFFGWYKIERTLSIHTIYTKRRELFYWAVILFTFALGTAAGDLVAEGLNLGYATAGFGFACIIAAVTVAHLVFKANGVTSFWIAYILTRPLGASLGDFLSQPGSAGGLGLGTTSTSVLFLTAILILVFYMTSAQKKVMVEDRS